jgi:hypothetical protein
MGWPCYRQYNRTLSYIANSKLPNALIDSYSSVIKYSIKFASIKYTIRTSGVESQSFLRNKANSIILHQFPYYMFLPPITVIARSTVWTVLASSNAGIVGSNPTWGINVCVRLLCVCLVLCVGSGLAKGWSPVKGVLPTVYRIKKPIKKAAKVHKGCRAADWQIEMFLPSHNFYLISLIASGEMYELWSSSLTRLLVILRNKLIFKVRSCQSHAQPKSWRTTPCRLLIQYIRSYAPIWRPSPPSANLRTRHAVVTRDPLNMELWSSYVSEFIPDERMY